MIIVDTMEDRDAVENAKLCVNNGDGTWTVYTSDEIIPAEYAWIFAGAGA